MHAISCVPQSLKTGNRAGNKNTSKPTGYLGNHDYYGGSIESVRKIVEELLNDYVKIHKFVKAGGVGRLALFNSLGDQATTYFKNLLPKL